MFHPGSNPSVLWKVKTELSGCRWDTVLSSSCWGPVIWRLLAGQPSHEEKGNVYPNLCQLALVSKIASLPSLAIGQSRSQAMGGCPEFTFASSTLQHISQFLFFWQLWSIFRKGKDCSLPSTTLHQCCHPSQCKMLPIAILIIVNPVFDGHVRRGQYGQTSPQNILQQLLQINQSIHEWLITNKGWAFCIPLQCETAR